MESSEFKMDELVHGVEVEKIIFSWLIAGGDLKGDYHLKRRESKMCKWLRSFTLNGEPFTEDEIRKIFNTATSNGIFELQELAKRFLKEGA